MTRLQFVFPDFFFILFRLKMDHPLPALTYCLKPVDAASRCSSAEIGVVRGQVPEAS
jgi:hypothetical protein